MWPRFAVSEDGAESTWTTGTDTTEQKLTDKNKKISDDSIDLDTRRL